MPVQLYVGLCLSRRTAGCVGLVRSIVDRRRFQSGLDGWLAGLLQDFWPLLPLQVVGLQ